MIFVPWSSDLKKNMSGSSDWNGPLWMLGEWDWVEPIQDGSHVLFYHDTLRTTPCCFFCAVSISNSDPDHVCFHLFFKQHQESAQCPNVLLLRSPPNFLGCHLQKERHAPPQQTRRASRSESSTPKVLVFRWIGCAIGTSRLVCFAKTQEGNPNRKNPHLMSTTSPACLARYLVVSIGDL